MNPGDKQQEDTQEPLIIIEKSSKKGEGESGIRKYSRGKVLGKGGFATCYEITELDTNKVYAAKIVTKASLTKKRALEKLLAEIKIHKSLNHEHIVQFERVFEDKENVYIILEICTNQTLKELLKKRKRIPENECALYLTQTILALKYLHEKKIIHRDLKLGNLLLGESYNIKVGDFGLAAKIEHDGEKRRTICGTPNYIAPEVLDKKIGHSYEVDIWALGVICYTLLIGKPPYETNDTKATYRKIMRNNYTFPTNVTISDEAKDLIKSILLLDPAMRLTLDEIIQHPFIKKHTSTMDSSSSTLKKPLAVSKIQSPTVNTGYSLPSDRAFHLPSSSQNVKEALDKNVYETEVKDNLSSSAKRDVKPTSNSMRPQTIGTDTRLKYLTAQGPEHRANSEVAHINDFGASNTFTDFGLQVNKVAKWVDYSSKYGLGYVLADGTAGILFNDMTKMSMSPDEMKIEYLKKNAEQQREVLSAYNMSSYPKDLQKKVLLLKHFKEYLIGSSDKNDSIRDKEKEGDNNEDKISLSNSPPLVYVKKWLKTKHAVLFRLSNKVVQVDFEDKTQIIIHSSLQVVYYLNKKGERNQYPLMTALDTDYPEMVKRLKYTKDLLTHIRQQGNLASSGGNKGATHTNYTNYNTNQGTGPLEVGPDGNTMRDGVSEKLPQMNVYRGMTGVGEGEK